MGEKAKKGSHFLYSGDCEKYHVNIKVTTKVVSFFVMTSKKENKTPKLPEEL